VPRGCQSLLARRADLNAADYSYGAFAVAAPVSMSGNTAWAHLRPNAGITDPGYNRSVLEPGDASCYYLSGFLVSEFSGFLVPEFFLPSCFPD
jgi:hypothetical protein